MIITDRDDETGTVGAEQLWEVQLPPSPLSRLSTYHPLTRKQMLYLSHLRFGTCRPTCSGIASDRPARIVTSPVRPSTRGASQVTIIIVIRCQTLLFYVQIMSNFKAKLFKNRALGQSFLTYGFDCWNFNADVGQGRRKSTCWHMWICNVPYRHHNTNEYVWQTINDYYQSCKEGKLLWQSHALILSSTSKGVVERNWRPRNMWLDNMKDCILLSWHWILKFDLTNQGWRFRRKPVSWSLRSSIF